MDSGTSGAAATPCAARVATSSGTVRVTAHSTDTRVKAARLTA